MTSIVQVDTFTREPFAGNPAAVCLLPEPRSDAWMQSVAREMNLAETAFLVARPDGFDLRWFTPSVEVESEDVVRRARPDFGVLKTIGGRGVILTSRAAAPGYDFVSRFFAPAAGIDEDPVTGSAHCCLGPFWSGRLGRQSFLARQISARGGVLKVRLKGDRVLIGGQAVTVLRGDLVD
jgi:predicted PhzF superfamily epimerase YddE/YHI9